MALGQAPLSIKSTSGLDNSIAQYVVDNIDGDKSLWNLGDIAGKTAGGVSMLEFQNYNKFYPGVGDSYGGGIVSWILYPVPDIYYDPNAKYYIPGEIRGLILAPVDQAYTPPIPYADKKVTWGSDGEIDAIFEMYGEGKRNTEIINAYDSTSGIAPRICTNYISVDHYDDWYLPNKNELLTFLRLYSIVRKGNFQNYWYWS